MFGINMFLNDFLGIDIILNVNSFHLSIIMVRVNHSDKT
jgi:hypothetical protein